MARVEHVALHSKVIYCRIGVNAVLGSVIQDTREGEGGKVSTLQFLSDFFNPANLCSK